MSISEEIRKPTLEHLRIYMEPMPYKQNAHPEDAKTGSGNAQREDRSPLSGLAHPANAGVTQRLECNPYKVEVAGPNPAARTIPGRRSERLRIRDREYWRRRREADRTRAPEPSPKVLINRKIFLYEAKAPFSPSGKSILGAIEYRPDSEEMRCHECGYWLKNLSGHLSLHGISARDYKLKHGLKVSTSLASASKCLAHSNLMRKRNGMRNPIEAADRMRYLATLASGEKRYLGIKAAGESRRNARGACRLQTLEKIKTLSIVLGRTPSKKDLLSHGVYEKDVVFHFGSIREAQRIAGLTPNIAGYPGSPKKFTNDFLVGDLRNFLDRSGRIPRYVDINRGLTAASTTTLRRCFGSMLGAIRAAFSSEEIAKDGHWLAPYAHGGRPRKYMAA